MFPRCLTSEITAEALRTDRSMMTEGMWENTSFLFNASFLNETAPGGANTTAAAAGAGVAELLISLVYVAVCVVGLGGNSLVIHIVLHYSKMESVTNLYILNLAVADELFVMSLPFLAVQNWLQAWPFGSVTCCLVLTADAVNQFTSIFCLTVMSVDRYLAVVHPVRSARWRRPPVAKAVNGAVWALALLVILPFLVFANIQNEAGLCNIAWPPPESVWRAAFIVYTSTVGFFCPLLVICLCYLLIVVTVRRSAQKVHAAASGRRRKSERKVTRMVVMVVALFVLCWLPFYALNILNLLVALSADYQGVYYFVVVLSYANSCANPLVYGFLSDNFKRGFRKALCRSARRVENQEPPERQQRRGNGRAALVPRESLKGVAGGNRDDGDDGDDGDEDVSEMTEIYQIAQNGNRSFQQQSSEPLVPDRDEDRGDEDRGDEDGGDEDGGDEDGDGGGTHLSGTGNGSVKTLPEENVEPNASLEISYL